MSHVPIQIANFFAAMQAGYAGIDHLASLFSVDAEYIEPFSGAPTRHIGRRAIAAAFDQGAQNPLPDMHVQIDHAETTGSVIRVRWTCFSPGLPGGKGTGTNLYEIGADGLIVRLETALGEGPST